MHARVAIAFETVSPAFSVCLWFQALLSDLVISAILTSAVAVTGLLSTTGIIYNNQKGLSP